MNNNEMTKQWYSSIIRPRWAPPSWIFGPVWTVLYLLIAISFGSVFYMFNQGLIPFIVLLPFGLNLIFNFVYSPIQFRWRKYFLASVDILLVLGSLLWALVSIYPYAHWITIINIPYFLWVSFATILQITVTRLNWRQKITP